MNIAQQFLLYANRIDCHKRAEMTGVLARAYAAQKEPHPEQEDVLLALTAMAADPAHEVRRALADVVAGSNQFPRTLHVTLSKDIASVAEPVFAQSKVLSDAELLAGLANNNQWIQCAIAGRPDLSADVVEALARNANVVAAMTLLRNDQSSLTPNASEWIWQRFEDQSNPDHKIVMVCLLRRHDVPASVKVKIDFLGDAPDDEPQYNLKIIERRLDQILMRASQAEDQELPYIASFLHERQWLNTVVIIRAALAGQLSFTAALLAKAASIKHSHATRLCRMGGFGLRALCRYAGISNDSGQLLQAILDEVKARQDGQGLDLKALTRLIRLMESQGAETDNVLYCMLMQLEARQLVEDARHARYDLALKSIVEPDMPVPTPLQYGPGENGAKQSEVIAGDSHATDMARKIRNSGYFGSLSYGNLSYRALSA